MKRVMKEKNQFVKEYLKVVNYKGEVNKNIETLREIHKKHLLNIPFENLNIINKIPLEFNFESLCNKIIKEGRGGLCYELNGLFLQLLREIGFDAQFLGAQVSEYGNEYDHVLIMVKLDGESWLLDVGFGDNFLYPIKLILNEPQKDIKGYYKIVKSKDEQYDLVKSKDNKLYNKQYTFTLKERRLEEFEDRCRWFETSESSRFNKYKLCAKETEHGRISLKDYRLLSIDGENIVEKPINDDIEFKFNLKKLFNIEI